MVSALKNNKYNHLNHVYYRTKKRANNLKKTGENLLDFNFEKLFNPKLFNLKKIISEPKDSGSGSLVYLVSSKTKNYQYVLKITLLESSLVESNVYRPNLNMPELETKIYQIMNILVKKNVTPHIFQIIDFKKNVPINKLNHKMKKNLLAYDSYASYAYIMLNETSSKEILILTLYDFLSSINNLLKVKNVYKYKSKIIFNIYFQLIYTLDIFNKIGIKHNDLHSNNIFVVIRQRNIFLKNNIKINKKYIFTSKGKKYEVLLEDIGIDIRIYDFDRSVKHKSNFKYFKSQIKSELIDDYEWVGMNNKKNPYVDIYKITASTIRDFKKDLPQDFIKCIESCYRDKNLLYRGMVGNRQFIKEQNYLYLNLVPKGYMDPTDEVLVKLVPFVNNNKFNKFFETFSFDNLLTPTKPKKGLRKPYK